MRIRFRSMRICLLPSLLDTTLFVLWPYNICNDSESVNCCTLCDVTIKKPLGECSKTITICMKPENIFNPITFSTAHKSYFLYILLPSSSANASINKPIGECFQKIPISRKPENLLDRRRFRSFRKKHCLAYIESLRVSKYSQWEITWSIVFNECNLQETKKFF